MDFEPKIVAFLCNWCAYAGADLAGVSRIEYPPNLRIIRVMCSSRVQEEFIFRAFARGADGVLILACHPGDCHYGHGNEKSLRTYLKVREMLKAVGLEEDRIIYNYVSAAEGVKFVEIARKVTEKIKALGPSPFRVKGSTTPP